MEATSVSVVVPATSANLGCAFDCAGIALGLHLRAHADVSASSGLSVSCSGVDAARISASDDNLVLQALRHAVAQLSKSHPGAALPGAGIHVDLQNEIPLGIGLGSSAAAILTGVLLGAELCGVELSADELLRIALTLEGHPDNLAAAIHGGMVVAAMAGEPAEAVPAHPTSAYPTALVAQVKVSSQLDFIAVIPDVPLPTSKARAALPASYSRQDVVANLQRTALLTATFFSGRRLVPELFRDRLHQPYRSPLVPGIAQCLEYRHPGLLGIFLSGAGSAVMAITEGDPAVSKNIAGDLVGVFGKQGVAARALLLKADNRGTEVTRSTGSRTFPVAARS